MNTPYKKSANLQGNPNQNNQPSAALYPSMQSGFIPFEESTPINRNKFQQNSRNNTPYNNTPYFSGNRQNQRAPGEAWSQNRNNRNFWQNSRNSSHFAPGDDSNLNDNKDAGANFNKPQYQNASGSKVKYNNFHQNNRRDNFFNNRRGGNRLNYGGGGHNKYQDKDDNINISKYVHPSMLEDPWKELLKRHNALNPDNLKIFSDDKDEKEALSSSDNESSPDSVKDSNSNEDENISSRISND